MLLIFWQGMSPYRYEQAQIGTEKLAPLKLLRSQFSTDETRKPLFSRFGQGAQAARTDAHPLPFPVQHHSFALDVGLKLALGRHLRVADIMTEGWSFTTNFTFCHGFTSWSR